MGGQWAALPHDLQGQVLHAVDAITTDSGGARTRECMSLVCKNWNAGVKAAARCLCVTSQPPAAATAQLLWPNVTCLRIDAVLRKHGRMLPAGSSCLGIGGTQLTSRCAAAALTVLQLPGQDLSSLVGHDGLRGLLEALPGLTQLDLTHATLSISDLAECIAAASLSPLAASGSTSSSATHRGHSMGTHGLQLLPRLRALILAGVQDASSSHAASVSSRSHPFLPLHSAAGTGMPPLPLPHQPPSTHSAPRTATLRRLITALSQLPHLRLLDLSLLPYDGPASAEGTVCWEGLYVWGLGSDIAAHLPNLTALHLARNPLAPADHAPLGTLSCLEHLSLYWTLGYPHVSMRVQPTRPTPADWLDSITASAPRLRSLHITLDGSGSGDAGGVNAQRTLAAGLPVCGSLTRLELLGLSSWHLLLAIAKQTGDRRLDRTLPVRHGWMDALMRTSVD